MTEFKPIKEGKVREIYDNGDSLIMVATDRISAFDVILKNKVTNKGKVLRMLGAATRAVARRRRDGEVSPFTL